MKLREKIRLLRYKFTVPPEFSNIDEQAGISFDKNCHDPHIAVRVISKEGLAKLKSFTKAHNATVNDMLLALYMRSLCINTGARDVRLPTTMDLRKFIPADAKYGISNFACAYDAYFSFEPGDSLADTLQQVSRHMQTYKTGNNILSYALSWWLTSRIVPYASLKRHFTGGGTGCQITFTNIGIIDHNLLCFGDLVIKQAYITSMLNTPPPLLLNASTFDGCCTLSCDFCGSERDVEFVNTLLATMSAEVDALA
jgi:NRPS condensation-like uncharacterized protein